MKFNVVIVAIIAVLVLVVCLSSNKENYNGTPQVTLFEEKNYGGKSITLSVGDSVEIASQPALDTSCSKPQRTWKWQSMKTNLGNDVSLMILTKVLGNVFSVGTTGPAYQEPDNIPDIDAWIRLSGYSVPLFYDNSDSGWCYWPNTYWIKLVKL